MVPAGNQRETRYVYDEWDRLRVKNAPEGTLTYTYLNGGQIASISARTGYSFPANPPYTLADELKLIFPELMKLMQQDKGGFWRVEWINGE